MIVLSILIAFAIDAWWDQRQDREHERNVLEALMAEALENRRELDLFVARTEDDMERADRFFRATPEQLAALPSDSTNPVLRGTLVPWTFDPDLTSSRLLLTSSLPTSRGVTEVRRAVAEWVRLVEDAEEEKRALTDIGNDLLERVALATPETASGGFAPLDEMSSRAGSRLLGTLRRDASYVAGVMTKTHQQGIYLGEIMAASAMLDSVLFLLEERRW